MLSSGSLLMSSTGGSDDIMDESWLQQQQQADVDEHSVHTETPYTLEQCPLDTGSSSNTSFGNANREGDDDDGMNRTKGNNASEGAYDPATVSRAPAIDGSFTDVSKTRGLPQATSVDFEPVEKTDGDSINATAEADEEILASAATAENFSEQNSQESTKKQNEDEEPVSASQSAEELLVLPSDDTKSDVDSMRLEHTSDDVQNTSDLPVEGGLSPSDDAVQCNVQSENPGPQTAAFSADKKESATKHIQDAKQPESLESAKTVAGSVVRTKSRTKKVEEQTTASKKRVQGLRTTTKKETGSSSLKPTISVVTKKNPGDTQSSRSTNPVSVRADVSASSKERRLRSSTDSEQLDGNKKAPPKKTANSERKNDKTDGADSTASNKKETAKRQPSGDSKPSLKSSSSGRKASEVTDVAVSTSSASAELPEATEERGSNPSTKSKAAKAAQKTPGSNNCSADADSDKTASRTKSSSSIRNAGKETSLTTKESSKSRNNPGPEHAGKDGATGRVDNRKAVGKQPKKSTAADPIVSRPVSDGKTDRPVDKLPTDASTGGNPGNAGNPRPAGGRATTSRAESKDAVSSTKKSQTRPSFSKATGAAAAEKPATSKSQGRLAGQTTKTTPRTEKSSVAFTGDSKNLKSSGEKCSS